MMYLCANSSKSVKLEETNKTIYIICIIFSNNTSSGAYLDISEPRFIRSTLGREYTWAKM